MLTVYPKKDRKFSVAIIGAGRIAHSLIPQLKKAGLDVKIIISRTNQKAKEIASKYSVKYSGNNYNLLTLPIDLVLIAVNDSEIKKVAQKISKLKISFDKILFVHLSGSKTSDELNSLKKKGGLTASFHIMQTFPSFKPVSIKNCYAAIETQNKYAKDFLMKLAREMNLKAFQINPQEKIGYHLLGVYASNFLSSNFYVEEILEKNDLIKISFAKEFMIKIAQQTLDNIKNRDVKNSISGPIVRRDIETIKAHINFLRKNKILLMHYLTSSVILLHAVENDKTTPDKNLREIKNYLLKQLRKLY
ncbi:Rossmann-like and DUF2520 domain-containing protein [Melioribacteraceae bacterium 4301-Me]|uniref:Rossmann-like and DUF2520 domain-containing protein n=1 Tax=Pyranulibacter aquaticus TaxID=3163344 RepID=UPI00359685C7